MADTLSDSNPTIISYYKNAKVTALRDTYKSSDYTINVSGYNTIFNNLAASILDLTTKSAIDVEITQAIANLDDLKSDYEELNDKRVATKESLRVYLYETNLAKLESIGNNPSKEEIYTNIINAILKKNIKLVKEYVPKLKKYKVKYSYYSLVVFSDGIPGEVDEKTLYERIVQIPFKYDEIAIFLWGELMVINHDGYEIFNTQK